MSPASLADVPLGPDGLPEAEAFLTVLRSMVGTAPSSPRRSRQPVNLAMINHWRDALADANPAYVDGEVAARSRHRGQIAPPAMLQSWLMDGEAVDPDAGPSASEIVMAELDRYGFISVVATNYDHSYARPLRIGDELTAVSTLEDVGPRKKTALGIGHFVTTLTTYTDASGATVGTTRMRVLKFLPAARADAAGAGSSRPEPVAAPAAEAPSAGAAASPVTARPRPVVNRDNQFYADGVAAGQLRIQRCTGCDTLRHPPRPMCARCQGMDHDWVVASGRGVLHSYVVHHDPPLAGFTRPFTVGLVDLAEGTRFVAQIVSSGEVEVGQPVELVWVEPEPGLTLPAFRTVTA